MKIRKGFVSNSSSTSFTCEFCGRNESGMDMSIKDCEMFECENGHICCTEHNGDNDFESLSVEELKKFVIDIAKENFVEVEEIERIKNSNEKEELEEILGDLGLDIYDYCPEKFCPLCSFKKIADKDFIRYIYSTSGKTEKDYIKEIKSQVNSYKEFLKKFKKGSKKIVE